MDVLVNWTLKCHFKLAGEWIEYSWGCAKNSFRHRPLSDKSKTDEFRRTVRQCLSREVLSTIRVWKISKWAWDYIICTYHTLHAQHHGSSISKNTRTDETHHATPKKIEKSQQCALDFDEGFIKASIVKSSILGEWWCQVIFLFCAAAQFFCLFGLPWWGTAADWIYRVLYYRLR